MDAFDREEQLIEDEYERGEIDAGERDRALRTLAMDYQQECEEEAQRAYNDRIARMRDMKGGW